jgi:glutamate decarboxylase
MPARAAYQLIHDELNLDGNPALNLASFVTTWMEPEAQALATETLNRNFVDQDEYPQTEEIHHRVVSMVGRLFNAPADGEPAGTATIGSSEAIMLGLLAHKWNWRARRGDEGARPNVVFGADVHTCWEKFARYFDVEQRVIPLTPERHVIGPEEVAGRIDENTIAVGAILGTTFTGQVDEIAGIDELLRGIKQAKGWDIPIHVDAASGGFIAPFSYPELEWDFRLEQVRSINVSNHKFGLVYPGMGSVVFRDVSVVPEELVFKINYLGGEMANYSLNFSRASNAVLLQCYNFLRLGREGYERIVANLMQNAGELEQRLTAEGTSSCSTTPATCPRSSSGQPGERKASTSSSSPSDCASGAGSCPRTRCRRTPSRSPCSAWWSRRTSAATWPRCSARTSSALWPRWPASPRRRHGRRARRSAASAELRRARNVQRRFPVNRRIAKFGTASSTEAPWGVQLRLRKTRLSAPGALICLPPHPQKAAPRPPPPRTSMG